MGQYIFNAYIAYVCILVFAFSCCVAVKASSPAVTSHHIYMKATPNQIHLAYRKDISHVQPEVPTDVTLQCRSRPQSMSGINVISMILAKQGLGDIATITYMNGNKPSVKKTSLSNQITAVGHVATGDAHASLQVSMKNVGGEAIGVYQCHMLGHDADGHALQYEATVEIADSRPLERLPLNISALPTYKGHYYYLSHPDYRSHEEANSACKQFGGYLVEVQDKDEMDFVSKTLSSMDVPHGCQRVCAQLAGCGYINCVSFTLRLGAHYNNRTHKWVFMTSNTVMNKTAFGLDRNWGDPETVHGSSQSSYLQCLTWDGYHRNFGDCGRYSRPDNWSAWHYEDGERWMCEIPAPVQHVVG